MAILFTSDTHFGDHRVLNLHRRPFASVAEMDEEMLARWNAVVGEEDEVWHLGDFARTLARAADILPRLNGRKHLLLGNNDPAPLRELGWASVDNYAELTVDGVRLVLCHYPLRSWNGMHRGVVDLHGHSHGRLAPLARQFDVGVDARDFRPVPVGALLSRGRRRAPSAAPTDPR